MTRDLHRDFADPRQSIAAPLLAFLEEADRLPAMRAAQRAMREALALGPGMRVLDAGCGVGHEAARLAADVPGLHVTGADLNAELLAVARDRSDRVEWLEADLTELELPPSAFDGVRTERVLMHLPEEALPRAVDNLVKLLAPGGRLALFELDYASMILAPGGADDPLLDGVHATLCASLPQPRAGRRLPGLLAARGLLDVTATPFPLMPTEVIWRRIVADTVLAGSPSPAVAEWLERQGEAAARGEFVAVFTGVLTTATRP